MPLLDTEYEPRGVYEVSLLSDAAVPVLVTSRPTETVNDW